MNRADAVIAFGESVVRAPKLSDNCFLLSGDKIFYTLQGEGPNIGSPAIFLRLHMCNLHCDWRAVGGGGCDAWYTWDDDKKEYWTEHSLVSFFDVLQKIQSYPCKRLIFTGGEPLLQQDQITAFNNTYLDLDWKLEIETNGTITPNPELQKHNVQFNCSPKLSNSGNVIGPNPKTMHFFASHPYAFFKFVVAVPRDLDEVEDFLETYRIPPEKVLIMPEGVDDKVLTERMRWLADVCQRQGYRLAPRLQISIWGNTRGT
jgi:organic radical activating enzyme